MFVNHKCCARIDVKYINALPESSWHNLCPLELAFFLALAQRFYNCIVCFPFLVDTYHQFEKSERNKIQQKILFFVFLYVCKYG